MRPSLARRNSSGSRFPIRKLVALARIGAISGSASARSTALTGKRAQQRQSNPGLFYLVSERVFEDGILVELAELMSRRLS